ncbi:ABC transporter ATP-binding protein [Chengkuizengella axinellae]|uniref:ABC transporter ATP-binding protein n=1 Tax=Chengkuizengella axinellae TaxID=3064388 RepID=A0ABT9J2F9_9BACL|nr:ABC transporter ATP-binding protein [Chengkuizengella sp. 2205SS18-9]MDP5275797.1 ABC transporter ATP-binding protein [Chengkuizengella sp. 2205SS18-9]
MGDLVITKMSKKFQHQITANDSSSNPPFQLRSADLKIHEGEFFGIIGPSGCGKTTLLKCIAGLISPDKGEIFLGKENVTHVLPEKRQFSMVFQQPLLFPHMKVIDNVAFGLKMQGINKKMRWNKAKDMLQSVGLSGYEYRHPSELSGGQQQRVSLARALLMNPKVLFLDEPFSALDPDLREEMRELVKLLHQKLKVTVLLVTHDREEAFQLADRLAIMDEGKVLQIDSPKLCYEKPVNVQVAKFLGSKNVIEGEVSDGIFRGKHLEIAYTNYAFSENKGWIIIRPELLKRIHSEIISREEGIFNFTGRITEVSYRSGFVHYKVNVHGQTLYVIESNQSDLPEVNEQVTLQLNMKKVHFIPQMGS